MGKLIRVIRCHHCGAVLQSEEKNEKGYIEKSLLNKIYLTDPDMIAYCKNCYDDLLDINASKLSEEVDKDILTILDDAVATDALIIWVVDLFSFNGKLKKAIVEKIKNLKVTVVATKKDLFPKYVKDEHLQQFVYDRFVENGITPVSVHILDFEGESADELVKRTNTRRMGHDVYMIGNNLSGKTTLINKCLKYYVNPTKRAIQSRIYENTNVKVLEIPLSNSSFLYELPGMSLDTSVLSKVEKDVRKYIIPKKTLKTTLVSLNVDDSIVLGNLAAFALYKGKQTNCKLYTAEAVETKKMVVKKLDDYFEMNYKKRVLRPVADYLSSFKSYDIFQLDVPNDGKSYDISICGLGWLNFIAKGQTFRVVLPKGSSLRLHPAKVSK